MKAIRKILIIGIIAILILDVIGSLASKTFNFNYANLTFLSLLVYGLVGFKATQIQNLKTAALLGGIIGLVDATAGWALSTAIGANVGNIKFTITPITWLITAVFVTCVAAACGLIGGALANFKRSVTSN